MMNFRLKAIVSLVLLVLAVVLGGCALVPTSGAGTSQTNVWTPTPTLPPPATVTLRAHFPAAQGEFEVAVLDEVTGLNINPTRYPMRSVGNGVYQAVIQAPRGTILKYRYERHAPNGAVHLEGLTDGTISRYRLALVSGDMVIDDTIARWDDTEYRGAVGRVFGRITDEKGTPVPDVMITVAGMRTFSLADGSFRLEGVPAGVHNLVAYHIQGRYTVFQHLVEVGNGTATQANITVKERPLVQVRFTVDVPPDAPQGAPVRLAGNLAELGNTFADLDGGLNTLAALMPQMKPIAPHKYTLVLKLPAGADLRYKYTLGDGFWNAERGSQGGFVLRRVIVPDHDVIFNDLVASWRAGASPPAWFEVTVPENTPATYGVAIQFNPAVWTPPLPMWYMGKNHWGYPLYGPTDIAEKMPYRFCLGGQCMAGSEAGNGVHIYSARGAREYRDSIRWRWFGNFAAQNAPNFSSLPKRKSGFWGGVALMPAFSPGWDARRTQSLAEIHAMHANIVVLTPSWTATRATPPFWEPRPPTDQFTGDLMEWSRAAHRNGLLTALYPVVHFPRGEGDWWNSCPATFPWWQDWFDRYRAFAVHYGMVAQKSGAAALVLGGDWVKPALPGGSLPNGKPSGVPADADLRWREILKAVRAVYSGAVYWAMPLDEALAPPKFVSEFDGVYLLWNPDLGSGDLAKATDVALARYAKAAAQASGKPVVLVVRYPAAKGARGGCVPVGKDCLPHKALYPTSPAAVGVAVDLAAQQKAYLALLKAVAQADYIGGVISADFYPPIALQDPSASVHGKPAGKAFSLWLQAILP